MRECEAFRPKALKETVRLCLVTVYLLGLSGCMVGPNYSRPAVDTQAKWSAAEAANSSPVTAAGGPATRPSMVQPGPDVPEQWWTTLDDATLDTLIDRAVRSNLDLRSAAARVREARADLSGAKAALFPTANVGGGYQFDRSDGPLFPAKTGDYNFYEAGFDATWELDIFGGERRGIEASGDSLQAQTEDRRDVLVSLLAEVCRDYVELRTIQRRSAIASDNLRIAQDSLGLTQRLRAVGVTGDLDVTRAQSEVTNTAASLPAFDAQAKQSIHALGVLLGQSPDSLLAELSPSAPIPQPPARVPVGLPSDLLRRRPDVRRVERQLAAATASIGVAEANLYPQFSLTGDFGVGATDTPQLFNWSSRYVSVGPSARWLLFDAGRVLADVDSRRAVREELLANYQETILLAVRDVEDSIIAFEREQERRELYRQTVNADAEAVRIANDQYANGVTGYLTVLDSERSLFAAQDALAVSDGEISLDLVALYKGLGGGWESVEKNAPQTPSFPRPPMPAAAIVER
ncbi:MAG: efflux transporter outer membrane subunit [Tepidisphaeraceae bacterium]|jgi:NodT family efflux transporter outer membrane factor (OMF) lipoprotein